MQTGRYTTFAYRISHVLSQRLVILCEWAFLTTLRRSWKKFRPPLMSKVLCFWHALLSSWLWPVNMSNTFMLKVSTVYVKAAHMGSSVCFLLCFCTLFLMVLPYCRVHSTKGLGKPLASFIFFQMTVCPDVCFIPQGCIVWDRYLSCFLAASLGDLLIDVYIMYMYIYYQWRFM